MAVIDLAVVQYFPMSQSQQSKPFGEKASNVLFLTQSVHVSPAVESIHQHLIIDQRVQVDQSIYVLNVSQNFNLLQSGTHGPTFHLAQTLMLTHSAKAEKPKLTSNKLIMTQEVDLQINKHAQNVLVMSQTLGLIHSRVITISQSMHMSQGLTAYLEDTCKVINPIVLHGPNDNPEEL